MASNKELVRFKKSQVEQHLRTIAQIQTTITDFELFGGSLDRQISAEEDRIKNHDPSHFAYSTLAKATIERRNNLMRSIDKLKIQLDAAKNALRENNEELEAFARLTSLSRATVDFTAPYSALVHAHA
jgi:flagellar FliJ protein